MFLHYPPAAGFSNACSGAERDRIGANGFCGHSIPENKKRPQRCSRTLREMMARPAFPLDYPFTFLPHREAGLFPD